MSKNTFKKISSIILVIIFILTIANFYILKNYHTISFKEYALQEHSQPLSNPYIGWYKIYAYNLNNISDNTIQKLTKTLNSDENSLCLLEINIKDYNNSSIPEYATDNLSKILDCFKQADKQVILRVLYDWDGKAMQTEPCDISIIHSHIDSLAPVINEHKDTIYINQGILVGDYGEMHHSNYMSDENMSEIAIHLSSAIDPSIYLSVRTPEQREKILKASIESNNSSQNTSLESRLGLFNDGMLGSESDLGTYKNRAEAIEYQSDICKTVPNGGEAVIDNSYNDIENAVSDLSSMHVSYLNCQYDLTVLNKWKSTAYNSINAYDYISNHLGYRFNIVSAQMGANESPFKKDININISLKNSGFSNSYKPMSVYMKLTPLSKGTPKVYKSDYDIRRLNSNCQEDISIKLPISEIDPGRYTISIQLVDDATNQNIYFANENSTDAGIDIGEITIETPLSQLDR